MPDLNGAGLRRWGLVPTGSIAERQALGRLRVSARRSLEIAGDDVDTPLGFFEFCDCTRGNPCKLYII